MSTSIDTFLKAGLTHYPEARQSVKIFEREVDASFDRVFKARKDWAPLLDVKHTRGGAGDESGSGCWIWRFVEGKTTALPEVIIETGLWWGAPDQVSVILYSRIRTPKDLGHIDSVANSRTGTFVSDRTTFLSAQVPQDLRLHDPLNRHLGILLEHLKTMLKRAKKP